ncbi:hypothetical protein LINPERPRIM_LOCUS29940, partial [Linum perenne]
TTATGGLNVDERGNFVHAFSANVGTCSITRAELCATVEGMKIVWALGVRKLDIQIDSKTSVSILKKEDKPEHQHAALVFEFQELKRREW